MMNSLGNGYHDSFFEQEKGFKMLDSGDLGQIAQDELASGCLSVVIFGGTGDLAKKKTFPALFALASQG